MIKTSLNKIFGTVNYKWLRSLQKFTARPITFSRLTGHITGYKTKTGIKCLPETQITAFFFPSNRATLSDCVSCCTPVAVPEKSHSYTNKKCIFLCYLHFCLVTNLSIYFFFFLQGTEKMLYLISGRPTDLNLLDLSQYWVLTKSKYSAALHMSCLLSWEENGKLLFPAFWKKTNNRKKKNFHIPCLESISLSSYILKLQLPLF